MLVQLNEDSLDLVAGGKTKLEKTKDIFVDAMDLVVDLAKLSIPLVASVNACKWMYYQFNRTASTARKYHMDFMKFLQDPKNWSCNNVVQTKP